MGTWQARLRGARSRGKGTCCRLCAYRGRDTAAALGKTGRKKRRDAGVLVPNIGRTCPTGTAAPRGSACCACVSTRPSAPGSLLRAAHAQARESRSPEPGWHVSGKHWETNLFSKVQALLRKETGNSIYVPVKKCLAHAIMECFNVRKSCPVAHSPASVHLAASSASPLLARRGRSSA